MSKYNVLEKVKPSTVAIMITGRSLVIVNVLRFLNKRTNSLINRIESQKYATAIRMKISGIHNPPVYLLQTSNVDNEISSVTEIKPSVMILLRKGFLDLELSNSILLLQVH